MAAAPGRRHTRGRTLLCVLVLITPVVTLGVASCGGIPDAGRVVARVNGKAITYGELVRELEAKHGPDTLLDMIDDAVVREQARKRGLTISPQEREAGLERAAARVGSMTDLTVKLGRLGVPLEAYQHNIETNLLLDKIVAQETKVTDAEIGAYYNQNRKEFERGPRVRARIMLFRDRANAEAVMEALKTPGSDFAGLAKSLSEDDATREAGGDTGYFEAADYAPAISDVAFKLAVGTTSELIEAPDGWVILRVEGRLPAGPLSLNEVKEQISQRLARERQDQQRTAWLVKARKAAKLSIRDRELREGVTQRLDRVTPPPVPGQL